MTPRIGRNPLGILLAVAVAIGATVFVVQPGPDTMQPRTPIDVASLGPQVGDEVPGFRLPDQNGDMHTLESILGPNGAMILFHRSADW